MVPSTLPSLLQGNKKSTIFLLAIIEIKLLPRKNLVLSLSSCSSGPPLTLPLPLALLVSRVFAVGKQEQVLLCPLICGDSVFVKCIEVC